LICGLVLPVLQDVSGEEWKTCVFYGLLCEFGLFWTQWMWRGKMKQTVLCYKKNMTGIRFIKKMKNLCCEKNVYNERKGKCFPVLIKRKTLSFVKVVFSVLTGIKFPLTSFPCCCQTWENKESEFQESLSCNQTRSKKLIILTFI
jgi:hypothetical protein